MYIINEYLGIVFVLFICVINDVLNGTSVFIYLYNYNQLINVVL
jgi:hypothetical protein